MAWWSDHVVPRVVDRALSTDDVMQERAAACVGLSGRVLEIGFGSGRNIGLYPAAVESVSAVEPSDTAWRMSADRRASSTVPIVRSGLDGQALDEPDATYDSVLSTFTLCTIPDVESALSEARRVLRPGGALVFLEHGLAPDPRVATWQRRLDPLQGAVVAGCHLTRDMAALVTGAGFRMDTLDRHYLPGPAFAHPWTYAYSGTALAPSHAAS
ncbi:MAG: class I SAM-dependent methyltransferase [Aeromicrobium sp.]